MDHRRGSPIIAVALLIGCSTAGSDELAVNDLPFDTGTDDPTGGDGESGHADTGDSGAASETGGEDSADSEETGGDSTSSAPEGKIELLDWTAHVLGPGADDAPGATALAAGDVNGDGLDDLALGAYAYGGSFEAWVVPGPVRGDVDLAVAPTLVHLTSAEPADPVRALSLTDVDGDGTADLLVAVDDVFVFRGPLPATLDLPDADLRVTWSAGALQQVGAVGDLDGGGGSDIALTSQDGAWSGDVYEYGHVEVHHAASDGFLGREDALATFTSLDGNPYASSAVGPGDVDGDGQDDVWLGGLRLFYGPLSGSFTLDQADRQVTPVAQTWSFFTARAAGDTDGDGRADIALVGQLDADTSRVLFLGDLPAGDVAIDGLDPTIELPDAVLGASTTLAVADVDGDAHPDVILGGPGLSGGGGASVSVTYGPIAGRVALTPDATTVAATATGFGATLAAGDLDDDGYADVAAGALPGGMGGTWVLGGGWR